MPLQPSSGDVRDAVRQHAHPDEAWRYGTAGFRAEAGKLPGIALRCGLIAALRALQLRATVGLVVTASHNPESDNGVKLIDHDGAMLPPHWEQHATALAQCRTGEAVHARLLEIIAAEDIQAPGNGNDAAHHMRAEGANEEGPAQFANARQLEMAAHAEPAPAQPRGACVALGIDSRPTSLDLSECAAQGVWLLGASVLCLGMCTTPLAHFAVQEQWSGRLQAYFDRLAAGFAALAAGALRAALDCRRAACAGAILRRRAVATKQSASTHTACTCAAVVGVHCIAQRHSCTGSAGAAHAGSPGAPGLKCVVDCANGVGACSVDRLQGLVDPAVLQLIPCNTAALDPANAAGSVNDGCGSDFAQTRRQWPQGVREALTSSDAQLCCAMDGDADRIVFLCPGDDAAVAAEGAAHGLLVLDGDYIACLFAHFVQQQVAAAGLTEELQIDRAMLQLSPHQKLHTGQARAGVVQTAYANGASTAYLRDQLRLPVQLAKTGVKHLHAAAQQFDIGIYFEANGHGSIVFGDRFRQLVARTQAPGRDAQARVPPSAQLAALQQLHGAERVTNPAIGDAMSGLLLVAAIVRANGMSMPQWAQLYRPLCSRLATVRVADRYAITTTDCETRVARPAPLQAAVDAAVRSAAGGRAFVRPSGTEDVVRVYAEAPTQAAADGLCFAAMRAVHQHAQGVGGEPALPPWLA